VEPKAFLPTLKKSGGDTAAEMTQAFMKSAHQESWHKLNYHDEDVHIPFPTYTSEANFVSQASEAYGTYAERLFLPDVADAPKLHSNLDNDQFLDAISAPSASKGGRKKMSKRTADELIEISDESDEEYVKQGAPIVS
jgi:DNA-directed RNA polymerase-3 subunit RPC5